MIRSLLVVALSCALASAQAPPPVVEPPPPPVAADPPPAGVPPPAAEPPPATVAEPQPPPPQPPPPQPPPRSNRAARIAGGALLGVGLVGIIVGGTFGQRAGTAYTEINDPTPGYTFNPATEDRLHREQPLAYAFLTIGLAATATSVTLLLWSRFRK